MDNQNENNNDFYYGNDDVNTTDNAPDLVEEKTYSQTSQETQEPNPQPEAADTYGSRLIADSHMDSSRMDSNITHTECLMKRRRRTHAELYL